jgi:hypothetical protein
MCQRLTSLVNCCQRRFRRSVASLVSNQASERINSRVRFTVMIERQAGATGSTGRVNTRRSSLSTRRAVRFIWDLNGSRRVRVASTLTHTWPPPSPLERLARPSHGVSIQTNPIIPPLVLTWSTALDPTRAAGRIRAKWQERRRRPSQFRKRPSGFTRPLPHGAVYSASQPSSPIQPDLLQGQSGHLRGREREAFDTCTRAAMAHAVAKLLALSAARARVYIYTATHVPDPVPTSSSVQTCPV